MDYDALPCQSEDISPVIGKAQFVAPHAGIND